MCFNNCLIAACVCVLRIDLNLCGRLRVGNIFFRFAIHATLCFYAHYTLLMSF